MDAIATPQPWTQEARCAEVDGDLFFPPDRYTTRTAKRICQHCPVQAACLSFAIQDPSLWGVWGGTTIEERQRIRAARAREDNTRLARTRAAMQKGA